MNWGKSITLVMIAFIALMTYFFIRAMNNPSDLVREDYYAAELEYDKTINALNNAQKKGYLVDYKQQGDSVVFNINGMQNEFESKIFLMRPSNKKLDYQIETTTKGCAISMSNLVNGKYKLTWQWNEEEINYRIEKDVFIY